MSKSIYEQIGGEPAVQAAVDIFYKKVLADSRINHFFEGVDMERQRRKQTAFLSFAFGGPNVPSERSMQAVHKRLVTEKGMNDSHFDAVMEHLGATLVELNVPQHLIAEAAEIAESVREQVLNRVSAAS